MAMQQDINRKFPDKKEKRYLDETMISINSLGNERTFSQIRQEEIEKQIWRIKLEFYIDIAVLALIVTLLSIHLHNNLQGCGIPVREWILVFFIIWLTKSTFNLFKIYILRNNYESRFTFSATLFIIMNGILVIWLFIGYALFYSDSNDCSHNPNTSFFNTLMFIMLLIGYVVIFIYFALICTVPCIYIYVQNQREDQRRGKAKPQNKGLVAALSKTSYDPQLFNHENECKICLRQFDPKDVLTVLKCDDRHYFHQECIVDWVK